jgi:hypothetical protein
LRFATFKSAAATPPSKKKNKKKKNYKINFKNFFFFFIYFKRNFGGGLCAIRFFSFVKKRREQNLPTGTWANLNLTQFRYLIDV